MPSVEKDPEAGTGLDPRLARLLADAERRWGRGALIRLGDALRSEQEVIPTGFPALDDALGIGGLPCGRISEIFGPDSSGKHALAAHLVVQCQRDEGIAAYIDLDGQLDPEQMEVAGVDPASMLLVRPMSHLQGMEVAIRLARSGGIRLMIMDLVMGLRLSNISRQPLALMGPSLGLALRRLVSAVDKNGIAFVFLADRPTGSGARPSMGSQALRFFASVRLGMERREWIRRGRDVVGCRSLVQVVKNKLAPPLREAEVDLLFYRFPPLAPAIRLCRPSPAAADIFRYRDVGYAGA